MEEQATYKVAYSPKFDDGSRRGMNADDWRGFVTTFFSKLPQLMMVVTGDAMHTRLSQIIENVDNAKDAVMEAARESADLLVESVVEVLSVYGEGQEIPVVATRGLNAEHDAIVAEIAAALMRPRLKDEETGSLFEG